MKFFSTSGFAAFLLVNLANLSSYSGSVQAALLPRDELPPVANLPLNLVPGYLNLMSRCNAAGDNTYAAILYESGIYETFDYGGCITRFHDQHAAQLVVFCKSVTCDIKRTMDCSGGGISPLPVPFVGGEPIVNPFDVMQVLGGSAICNAP